MHVIHDIVTKFENYKALSVQDVCVKVADVLVYSDHTQGRARAAAFRGVASLTEMNGTDLLCDVDFYVDPDVPVELELPADPEASVAKEPAMLPVAPQAVCSDSATVTAAASVMPVTDASVP